MQRSKILDLPELDFNGTKILRKAKFVEMKWSDRENSQYFNADDKSLKLVWRVYPVDSEGNEIKNSLLAPYEKTLTAVNSTLVDKTTGEYINLHPIQNPDGTITVPEPNENAIGEYDYFVYIADNLPILATDMILQMGTKAVELGRFSD